MNSKLRQDIVWHPRPIQSLPPQILPVGSNPPVCDGDCGNDPSFALLLRRHRFSFPSFEIKTACERPHQDCWALRLPVRRAGLGFRNRRRSWMGFQDTQMVGYAGDHSALLHRRCHTGGDRHIVNLQKPEAGGVLVQARRGLDLNFEVSLDFEF